jgi:hypothetical protein
MRKAFTTHIDKYLNHDGFQMTFGNGCTISVMFGKYTFSDGGQTTAEVAAWNGDGDWMLFHEDRLPFDQWIVLPEDEVEVMSRQTADEVANLIFTLSKYSVEE